MTSEPYLVQQTTGKKPVVLMISDAGFEPVVLLLGDAGYSGYANIVTTSTKMVSEKPDLVQRFINASIEGWYSFLYGDPSPAFAAILKANPDMTPGLLHYGYTQLKERGILDSGDAKTLGIGAMTDARWKSFFDTASHLGLYPADLDYSKAYTLRFVDQKHGMDLKK